MNEDVACRSDCLTKVAEGQVWQKLLLGSGRIRALSILCS